ncbi:MAG: hypothetical protein U5K76_15390 [Woeseiaceae bacterium]|nr:hypothetical protein [Woeseiaceae bacterium]
MPRGGACGRSPPGGAFAPVDDATGRSAGARGAAQQAGEGEAPARSRFWLGVGSGAAIAASLTVAILSSGLLDTASLPATEPAGFEVALGEPRNVNIAIEMPHDLPDAGITVALTGGIELQGYAGRRELSWTTDLEAGVNKLTLPLVAVDSQGGRLLVRVGHGDRERRFSMDVNLES